MRFKLLCITLSIVVFGLFGCKEDETKMPELKTVDYWLANQQEMKDFWIANCKNKTVYSDDNCKVIRPLDQGIDATAIELARGHFDSAMRTRTKVK